MFSAVSQIQHTITTKKNPSCPALRPMKAILMDWILWGRQRLELTNNSGKRAMLKTGDRSVYPHITSMSEIHRLFHTHRVIVFSVALMRAAVTELLSEMLLSESHKFVSTLTSRIVNPDIKKTHAHFCNVLTFSNQARIFAAAWKYHLMEWFQSGSTWLPIS